MHSGVFLSPVGESAAEQEGPPEKWKDAVRRKQIIWRDSQLLTSSRGKQNWGISGGMGQPVSPLLLPWLPLSLCNGSPWVSHSGGVPGAAGKPQGAAGSGWLNLAVHAQPSRSRSLSPALPAGRGFRRVPPCLSSQKAAWRLARRTAAAKREEIS